MNTNLFKSIKVCVSLLIQFIFLVHVKSEQITIVGTGYVGLVCACAFSSFGNHVICVDIDRQKVQQLNAGALPIYEPHLEHVFLENFNAHRITCTSDFSHGLNGSTVIIVAVGTPMDQAGNNDLSLLQAAIATIAKNISEYKVICIKSTVPPGTSNTMKQLIKNICGHDNFDVVVNPEFMREGSALSDLFEKNPIVLGSDSDKAIAIVEAIYRPLLEKGRALIKTNFVTAELIKYAWNAYSFIKVAYVDELGQICKELNGNIADVVTGIGYSDVILPMSAIKPGPGIGGSCLPKDTRAFVNYAKALQQPLNILQASLQSDFDHQQRIIAEIYELLENNPKHKTVAILGLSYKANTDDIRNSPAITIIDKLAKDGARIKAYDPRAINVMRKQFPCVEYCSSVYRALQHADLLVLLTDWDEFKELDFERLFSLMKQQKIFDTRNLWEPSPINRAGFIFRNLGRI